MSIYFFLIIGIVLGIAGSFVFIIIRKILINIIMREWRNLIEYAYSTNDPRKFKKLERFEKFRKLFNIIFLVKDLVKNDIGDRFKLMESIDELVSIFINKNIIKDGTKYLIDLENSCIYISDGEILKQCSIDENKNIIENDIENQKDIVKIYYRFINWSQEFGLNEMYGKSIRCI